MTLWKGKNKIQSSEWWEQNWLDTLSINRIDPLSPYEQSMTSSQKHHPVQKNSTHPVLMVTSPL